MKKQAYQKPTIYNSDGTKAQTGTFDIRTDPLTNSTADGILDYYNNNLEALKAQADDSANRNYVDTAISNYVNNNIFRVSMPAGDTITDKLNNASGGITYWADYNSASYSPTGANGYWTFKIVKFGQNSIRYWICEAQNAVTQTAYRFINNKWYQVGLTALS